MQPRARVLAVAQSAQLGGAELALLRVAEHLPEHGFELEFTAPGDGTFAELARSLGPVHRLAVGGIQAGAWPRAMGAWPRAHMLSRGFPVVWLNGVVTQRLAPAMTAATIVPYVHELADEAPRAWRSPRFWRSAPIVMCSSQAVAVRARALGAPSGRTRVVSAPVGRAKPVPRPDWADRPVVGFVGQ